MSPSCLKISPRPATSIEDKIEAPKSQTGGYDIKLPDLPGKGMFDNLIVMGARLLSTINGIASVADIYKL